MSNKGGARPGAGRPKNSVNHVRVADYFTDDEKKEFFEDLKKRAKTDNKIAIYLAEQMTGKAAQALDMNMTGNISVQFDQSFDAPPSKTKNNRSK